MLMRILAGALLTALLAVSHGTRAANRLRR